jgi:putative ABC transport system permease protein
MDRAAAYDQSVGIGGDRSGSPTEPGAGGRPTSGRITGRSMDRVALRMLMGDRAKFLSLIFSVTFATFLISQQLSIFCGLMNRTRGQISDVGDVDLWVMDDGTRYFDEVYALGDNDLYRVRSVPGVAWAVPYFRATTTVRAQSGAFRSVVVNGLDDASLVGAPHSMIMGSVADLRKPDSVIVDKAGFGFLFPGEPLRTGDIIEINDHRVQIVGICQPSVPFVSNALLWSRYSLALGFVGRERREMTFVVCKAQPGVSAKELADRIHQRTGLKALNSAQFGWATIWYYIKNTGIPINFGITVIVALIVGTVISGQTFYIFTLENLKQFGALKAIGATNGRIVAMVVLQAAVVGFAGFSIGEGIVAFFFVMVQKSEGLRGIVLLWQVMAITAVMVTGIILAASLLSVRRLIRLEPAEVFRG